MTQKIVLKFSNLLKNKEEFLRRLKATGSLKIIIKHVENNNWYMVVKKFLIVPNSFLRENILDYNQEEVLKIKKGVEKFGAHKLATVITNNYFNENRVPDFLLELKNKIKDKYNINVKIQKFIHLIGEWFINNIPNNNNFILKYNKSSGITITNNKQTIIQDSFDYDEILSVIGDLIKIKNNEEKIQISRIAPIVLKAKEELISIFGDNIEITEHFDLGGIWFINIPNFENYIIMYETLNGFSIIDNINDKTLLENTYEINKLISKIVEINKF